MSPTQPQGGHEDDYLGGLVDTAGRPFPVYHAYRLYAATAGQTRVATEGNNRTIACLASRDEGRWEVLLGSVAQGSWPGWLHRTNCPS